MSRPSVPRDNSAELAWVILVARGIWQYSEKSGTYFEGSQAQNPDPDGHQPVVSTLGLTRSAVDQWLPIVGWLTGFRKTDSGALYLGVSWGLGNVLVVSG